MSHVLLRSFSEYLKIFFSWQIQDYTSFCSFSFMNYFSCYINYSYLLSSFWSIKTPFCSSDLDAEPGGLAAPPDRRDEWSRRHSGRAAPAVRQKTSRSDGGGIRPGSEPEEEPGRTCVMPMCLLTFSVRNTMSPSSVITMTKPAKAWGKKASIGSSSSSSFFTLSSVRIKNQHQSFCRFQKVKLFNANHSWVGYTQLKVALLQHIKLK